MICPRETTPVPPGRSQQRSTLKIQVMRYGSPCCRHASLELRPKLHNPCRGAVPLSSGSSPNLGKPEPPPDPAWVRNRIPGMGNSRAAPAIRSRVAGLPLEARPRAREMDQMLPAAAGLRAIARLSFASRSVGCWSDCMLNIWTAESSTCESATKEPGCFAAAQRLKVMECRLSLLSIGTYGIVLGSWPASSFYKCLSRA